MSLLAHGNVIAASGEDIFKSNNCGDCHSMTGSPAESFEKQQKEKGPNLWYAGSKYQGEWLESYLQKPTYVRPLAFGSIKEKNNLQHPALSAADAKAVTSYLASLTSSAVEKGMAKKANKGVRGKLLFKKKQACYGCHRIPEKGGKESGGFSGPSLVDAGQRLQGDWIYSFIKDPKPFIAAGRMPHYKHLKANEIKTISEYMMSFNID
jgi:mono/diheme cytochrome c family protein